MKNKKKLFIIGGILLIILVIGIITILIVKNKKIKNESQQNTNNPIEYGFTLDVNEECMTSVSSKEDFIREISNIGTYNNKESTCNYHAVKFGDLVYKFTYNNYEIVYDNTTKLEVYHKDIKVNNGSSNTDICYGDSPVIYTLGDNTILSILNECGSSPESRTYALAFDFEGSLLLENDNGHTTIDEENKTLTTVTSVDINKFTTGGGGVNPFDEICKTSTAGICSCDVTKFNNEHQGYNDTDIVLTKMVFSFDNNEFYITDSKELTYLEYKTNLGCNK